jgi:hypothetical protein
MPGSTRPLRLGLAVQVKASLGEAGAAFGRRGLRSMRRARACS